MLLIENICEEIFLSKKYVNLYKPLILRVCGEEYKKYPNNKEKIKGVKNVLHAMYGAYFNSDNYKKIDNFLNILVLEKQKEKDIKKIDQEISEKILCLHTSTKERMWYVSEFYNFIFENIGPIKSVLDIGCGLNPFTLPYIPNNGEILEYHALDIDNRIADLNNRYFISRGMPALAGCSDVAVEMPGISADVVFLFKLLPLIERQAKGRSLQLLKKIDAQYMIVTYPTKSLSGKKKGMRTFYADAFEAMIESIADRDLFISAKGEVGDELIYVVTKR